MPRSALTVTHRRYVPYSHAHYAGNLVDGAYSLAAFGDVATEMCIRTDGDEGLFASYSDVQFLAPVRAGDVIEIEARLVRVGTPFARDGVRGARRRPGRPRARRVRRRRARPARGGDHRPWGRGGAPAVVTYRWRVPTPLRYAARPAAAVAAGLCLLAGVPGAEPLVARPGRRGPARRRDPDRRCPAGRPARAGRPGWPSSCPMLSWSGVYVGALPWFALATLEALYIAAMSAVVGYAGRRLTAAGHGRCRVPASCRWAGWCRSGPRGATPYGGFPWARLAFSQADSPLAHVARWLGAPGVTFAVAVARHAAARRGHLGGAPVLGRGPRGAAVVAVALVAVAPLAIAAAHRRARRDGRLRAGQRAPGRARVQRPAPGRARQPRQRHRAAGRPAPRTTSPSSSGRRTPPTSTRSATPTPPRRSTNAVDAVGAPLLIGAVLAEPPATARTSRCSTCPGSPSRSATSSCTRCPSPSTSPTGPSSANFSPKVDLVAATSSPGTRSASSRVPGRGRRLRRHCRRSASRSPTTT